MAADPRSDGSNPRGIPAPWSVPKLPQSIFFLETDGQTATTPGTGQPKQS